ncbi:hypothetical protein P9429_11490 [Bacillus atrophaeus]|uniref:hypothetical protein n=1 Tax=Bacillus atrophaeus TaxID=1452 RepID=UPI002E241CDC|nr:hypothetical protein [Bacillus atrophaeus]
MADKRESINYKTKMGYGLINSYTKPDCSVKGGYDSGAVVNLDSKTGNINAAGDIAVKVNVEVSEAITGLKALQREAKVATKALAELREEQAKHSNGTSIGGFIPAEVFREIREKLVRLDEGEQIVPITEPTVYLDGKEIGKASGRGSADERKDNR